jgi:hypothetical protein
LIRSGTGATERGRPIEDLPNLPSQGIRAERLRQNWVSRLEPRTAQLFGLGDLGALGIPPQQSIQPFQLGHDPRGVDPGRREGEAFSMVAHSARSPASAVSIARSSARTAGEWPPVARNRTRWLA